LTQPGDESEAGFWADILFLFFQSDKKRVIDESEARIWADTRGYHYFETSAQTGEGVSEMFQVNF
jgi:hypothetical protein